MNGDKVKTLRDKLNIALKSVENSLDIKISVGVITYSDSDLDFN